MIRDRFTKTHVQRRYEQVLRNERIEMQQNVAVACALQDQFEDSGGIPTKLARVASREIVGQARRLQVTWGLSFEKSIAAVKSGYGDVLGWDMAGIHLMAIAADNGIHFTSLNFMGLKKPDDHRSMVEWLIAVRESAEDLLPERQVDAQVSEQWLFAYSKAVLQGIGKLGDSGRKVFQEHPDLIWLSIRFFEDADQENFVKCCRAVLESHTHGLVGQFSDQEWSYIRSTKESSVLDPVYARIRSDADQILRLYERRFTPKAVDNLVRLAKVG